MRAQYKWTEQRMKENLLIGQKRQGEERNDKKRERERERERECV